MKILWIPQLPLGAATWEGSRHYHLLRHLGRQHEVHVVSWKHVKRLGEVSKLGSCSTNGAAPLVQHCAFLAPNLYRMISRSYPKSYHLWLNQRLFQRCVTSIASAVKPDVCVYSSSHHATGFPPVLKTPTLFDYLDLSPEWVEEFYIRNASAVTGVSAKLMEIGRRFHKPTFLIPNGVDLEKYKSADRRSAKQKLGLEGHTVISLIGLTCSSRLYFVDAVAALQKKRPDVVFLVVGSGSVRDAILQRSEELKILNVRAVGWVPHADVYTYFAATDVGLYPGDDTSYYQLAQPLKVVEYTAAGAQVVCSPVEAFRSGWPNVHITQPQASSFAAAIQEAIEAPRPIPDIAAYDWAALTARFGQVFESIAR